MFGIFLKGPLLSRVPPIRSDVCLSVDSFQSATLPQYYNTTLYCIPNSTLTCFEVSSKGYISPRNSESIKKLHSFMKKDITFSTFRGELASLSLVASYHIFNCRNDPEFLEPPYLLPTFVKL